MATAGRPPVVCAIDIGTSAVRAAVVDLDGSQLAIRRTERHLNDGAASFQPADLRAEVNQALRALTDSVDAASIKAVGVAGHVGSVFVGSDRHPVCQGFTWAHNGGVEDLRAMYEGFDSTARIGRPELGSGAAASWLWLRRNNPEAADRVWRVLSPKDYVVMDLCGEACTDTTTAAYTLVFDVRERAWVPDLSDRVHLGIRRLPLVVDSWVVVGRVTHSAADETGLVEGTPVVAGGPDGTLGILGASGPAFDRITDVGGTTDVIARLVDPTNVEGLLGPLVVNPFPAPESYAAGGPTGMTGGAVAWVAQTLGYREVTEAERVLASELATLAPGCDGLLVSPSLTGSRFPFWNASDRGFIVGLTTRHQSAHLLRATAEGAGFVMRAGIEALQWPGDTRVDVVFAGGASRSPTAVQVRADILGREIHVPQDPDTTIRGAGVVAATGAGIFESVEEAWRHMAPTLDVRAPDPARAEAYEDVYRRWRQRIAASSTLGPGG